ncbi:hypothetical protein [Pasteuria penetrans]|uniref:hypothetical protein n=1 Tax=Pasteuria penetrans TaxID=86005 RepID=UPI0011ECA267|nr:hypothetical protein [Pasteuria penetrans]
MIFSTPTSTPPPVPILPSKGLSSCIRRDIVLLHGLANQHPFGEFFLQSLQKYLCKQNRLILVRLDGSLPREIHPLPDRETINQRIEIGNYFSWNAGTQSIARQTNILQKNLADLHQTGQLLYPYHLITHSLGGIVALSHIQQQPNVVEKFISIGAPYRGSALFRPFAWAASMVGGKEVTDEVAEFFEKGGRLSIPTKNFAPGGGAYTLAGDIFTLPHGRYGELLSGWFYLTMLHGRPSDGVLFPEETQIEGAKHLGTLPFTDHYSLIQDPLVAYIIATTLLQN